MNPVSSNNRSGQPPSQGTSSDASAWLAVTAGTIGALMATLDISVVNSSLPTIQGEIGATASEGTWVSTAYLVAEIIIIPLSGWLERMFSLRLFLMIFVVGFTAFSVICGLSSSLTQMIIGRVGQGFTGGALIPTALSIVATRLPADKQPVGVALFGLTAVLGPILGPLIGGYLTENYSWHYAFFLNVPIGLALLLLLSIGLPSSASHFEDLAEADWFGIFGLAVGLGCLTVVLEEGQRERWFESSEITILAIVSLFGFIVLLTAQFLVRKPVVKLKIILERSFGSVFIMSMVVGAALYGILFLIPQFLSAIPRYNSEQSGYVALVSGIPTLLVMPVFPFLIRNLDIRIAVAFGLFVYGISCFMNSFLTPEWSGEQFVWAQLLRGVGQAFSFLFLNAAATSAVSNEYKEDASGLFNAARNLGGSIGLAVITTMQDTRGAFHTERISESLHANSTMVQSQITQAAQNPDQVRQAMMLLKEGIDFQASVMSFSDIFYVLGIVLLLAVPLAFFLKPLPADASASPA